MTINQLSQRTRMYRRSVRALLALSLSVLLAATALLNCVPRSSAASLSDDATLYQALLDLTNPWTVMCVAAHPDDEDGATLTLLRRKYGVHTVSLFSTYGEGGQNATGPELYEGLGAIRERETEAAAKIQGSEPYFLGLRDFGFSKSAEEAFRIWGHDEALRRMVLTIRELRPDVIITNHDTVSGHGHHQATGRLVLEAFDAAADPTRFSEQIHDNGVAPWQAKRLFVRINYEGGTGSRNLEEEAERNGKVVSVNVTERDPLRNSTYAEQALQALHQHASQGPWPDTVPNAMMKIRYRLARESTHVLALPSHSQTFLDGLQPSAAVSMWLDTLKFDGRPVDFLDERNRVFDDLVSSHRGLWRIAPVEAGDERKLRLMNERLDRALAAASGIKITVTPREEFAAPASWQTFSITFSNTGTHQAEIFREVSGRRLRVALARGSSLTLMESAQVPASTPINVPRSEHLYDGNLRGFEFSKSYNVAIDSNTQFIDNQIRFHLPVSAHVDVAPPVEIASVSPSPFVLTPATMMRKGSLSVRLISHQKTMVTGRLIVTAYVSDLDRRETATPFRLSAGESRAA